MIGKFVPFVILASTACSFVSAGNLDGDWSGKLAIGNGRSLKLVIHVDESVPAVKMDSPDQGAYGLDCMVQYLKEDSINFRIPNILMSYEGKIVDGKLTGTFQQGGLKLPLTFESGVKEANRPQTPQPPFPYSEVSVRIENKKGDCVLAGTLTLPDGYTDSTPVAVLVSGSGAQNRDEELFEHKPFAVIADYLARNGIASLRYDDRGFAESTGNRTAATTEDYASDTKAVADWLRNQRRLGKVGIIGHSEGGMIAYMLAASDDAPDFIVSIAGPAVDGAKILDYQNKIALMKTGMTEEQAEDHARAARQKIESDSTMTWMQYFLKYDPASDISKIKIPAFIIYGNKDQQVPASLNYDTAKSLAPGATVKNYPGLNHMMQHAVTGGIEEYSEIEETISPELLSDITSFILQCTVATRGDREK